MKRAVCVCALLALSLYVVVSAQQGPPMSSGKNVNVVGGPTTVDPLTKVPTMGDPNLNRQNEPSMGCSSRSALNCLAGGNDYRRLDFPGVKDGKVTGDAWLGTYWTRDGGNTWRSALLPGYFEDPSTLGQASPAHPYEAAADPVVRPGTNGLLYYAGIAFNRSAIASNAAGTEGKDGVVFVARYIDDNNTQQITTPFRYFGASAVAFSNGARFLDKPTMAVDIPRGGASTCDVPAGGNVPAQNFPGGNVYVAYSAFLGPDDNVHTKLMFHSSTDCGQTWSGGVKLSESHKINQASTIGIHPLTGQVFVSWREFSSTLNADQILVATSNDQGKSFGKATVLAVLQTGSGGSSAFDQPSLPSTLDPTLRMFRTNSYPTMCVAGDGTAYVAWAQRGLGPLGETRIRYSILPTGAAAWSPAANVDALYNGNGHQFMPAIACGGDKVTAIWYDQRNDALAPLLPPSTVFGLPFLADLLALIPPARTLDVRAASAVGGAAFGASIPVTRYASAAVMGPSGPEVLQLQFNLENLPLFAGGVIPFIGDYIDVAPATVFLPQAAGAGQAGAMATGVTFNNKRRNVKAGATEPNGWVFNTTAQGTPVFNAIWTDNRDVTAGTSAAAPINFTAPPCTPGTQAGSKNQNIYTSRLTSGLVAGVFGNARPLGTRQRAFSVFVQNMTPTAKKIELRVANQPLGGGTASFIQFATDPPDAAFPFPLVELTADIAPFSAVARTVFVSGSANAPVRVDVDEIITVPGPPPTTTVGQQLFVLINPDPTNPAPLDPALTGNLFNETHASELQFLNTTEYDLTNPNFLNPTFLNPNFLNPNFLNPNFLNPTFLNPTFLNPNFLNPNFLNPNFLNPNFLNPTFLNPNFLNPNFLNPNFLNTGLTTLTEVTWDVSADGNTSSSYLLWLLSGMNIPPEWRTQLLIYRVYLSPASGNPLTGELGCDLNQSVQHDLLTDVLNPNFLNPNFLNTVDFSNPNFLNSALSAELQNATFSLASGDSAKIVLRVAHDGTFQPTFVTPAVIPEAIDTNDAANGDTTPNVGPVPLAFATAARLPQGLAGTPYSLQLQAIGGSGPGTYTWTYFPGPDVDHPPPPGGGDIPGPIIYVDPCFQLPSLELSASGLISGTPSSTQLPQVLGGVCVVEIHVTDTSNPQQTAVGFFTIGISNPLFIQTTAISAAIPNTPYSTTLQATGGVAPYAWSVTSGTLPPGISLSAAGVLSGTTPQPGPFPFSVQVVDAGPPVQTATRSFTLVVAQASLTFAQQPSDTSAGAGMTPAVKVLVRDGTGAVLPGVGVSLAFGTNPTGALLSGPTSATTDATGVATFSGVRVDRDGDVYTLAATAFGVTAVSTTFNIGSISFEMYPSGTPACFDCPVTTEFAGRGVTFSFQPNVPATPGARLTDSTGVDPVGPANHSISNPAANGGGWATGTMVLTFSGAPPSAAFRLRAPTITEPQSFSPFTVRAFDTQGVELPASSISQSGGTYQPSTACCGLYRQASVIVSNVSGIGRIEIELQGFNGYLDNLVLGVSNLLANGDFQTGDLTGWTVLNPATELQQQIVDAPAQFVPPLSGKAYRIRPGVQSPDAGLAQTVSVTPGTVYDWSVAIAAQEFQNPGNPLFPLGTFELRLNGEVVATVTFTDANPHTQSFSGTYTPTTNQIEFEVVFNRGLSSFTAHPQWFVDKAVLKPLN